MNAGLGPGTTLPAQQTHAEEGPCCSRTPPTHFLTASHLWHPENVILICGQQLVLPNNLIIATVSVVCFFFFPVFIELH